MKAVGSGLGPQHPVGDAEMQAQAANRGAARHGSWLDTFPWPLSPV